ncbi:MAG: tetratricopeptide repeat protein, partial [Myxococcota bacterium]
QPRFPIQARPSVKAALAAIDQTGTEPLDVVPLAVVMTTIASALDDHELEGAMRQRAQETGGVDRSPGVLRALSSLFLLNLGDFQRTIQWLEEGSTRYPAAIDLLTDLTRARVAGGLQDTRIRQLRMKAERSIERDGVRLPLGTFKFAPLARPVPLSARFDPSVFPEESIRTALDLEGISPAAAERRLGVVVNLKLAELELASGDYDAALARVSEALKVASSNPEVHLMEALVHKANGSATKARESIDEALRLATGEPHVLLAAANIQLASGDTSAAARSVGLMKEEGFYSPSLAVLEARMLRAERRYTDARRLLAEAQRTAPTDATAMAESILVEHADGRFTTALDMASALQRQVRANPSLSPNFDGTVRAYLAWSDATSGNYDAAVATLTLLADTAPDVPEAHFALGKVHELDGDTDAATVSYRTALERGASGAMSRELTASLRRLGGEIPDTQSPAPKRGRGSRKPGRRSK